MEKKQKKIMGRIVNWRHNAIQIWFNEKFGISILFAYGSYSDNYDGILYDEFSQSSTVELYPLGEFPRKVKKRLINHFGLEKEYPFPIARVDVLELPYVLNLLKRFSK